MNKVKKIISIILVSVILILTSCQKSITYITDISTYKDLTSNVDKIEVVYGNDDGTFCEFTIDKSTDISIIMDLILNTKLVKESQHDGNNTGLTIYKGTITYKLNVLGVTYDNTTYLFENNSLTAKITELKNNI